MKIGIDGNPLIGDKSGVGKYVYNLCKELNILHPDWDYIVYTRDSLTNKPVEDSNWTYVVEKNKYFKILRSSSLWTIFLSGRLINKDDIDLFWGTTYAIPFFKKKSIKLVITIYDFVPEIFSKTITIPHKIRHKIISRLMIYLCDSILTISNGTANKLHKFYGINSDEIINPGVDNIYYRRSEHDTKSYLTSLDIIDKYFIAVGTIEPRKNIETIVKAFIKLKNSGFFINHKLLIVGKDGWKCKSIVNYINISSKYGVVRLNYINEESLPLLYSGAEALIYPSLYEGFGMPVAECLSCGTPVITSDIEEIREAGRDSAIYISADVDSLFECLSKFSNHKPIINYKTTTWEQGARALSNLFIRVVDA